MAKLPIIDFLRRRQNRSLPPHLLKADSVLNVSEGEQIVVMYTSASDKMKIFSAFVREGLKNGDQVDYTYPDEESDSVRAKLKKHGIAVEKYERKGSLALSGLTEYFMPDGKFDVDRAVRKGLHGWAEAKRKGYNHVRSIEDVGDFSFVNGQWQKWIRDYWLDPRWDDPNISEWVQSKEPLGVVYDSFIMDVIAVNVERMTETEVTEVLKAFGGINLPSKRFFIDLIEDMDLFSRSIGLNHERLIGRKILLEFDPASDYEKVVDDLAKESRANADPIFAFTSSRSSIHTYLAKQPAVKFIFLSTSTSTPELTSENEAILPAKNTALVLDALSKVLEQNVHTNIFLVFDKLSDLMNLVGFDRTYKFLLYVIDILPQTKTTAIFLLNANAHELQLVSPIRGLFPNQLTYDKNGLKIVKIT
jgi:hypothetical protein